MDAGADGTNRSNSFALNIFAGFSDTRELRIVAFRGPSGSTEAIRLVQPRPEAMEHGVRVRQFSAPAGANVLLSAVLGGRAKAILEHPEVEEVVTAEATFAEVQEYAAQLAKKKRLPVDLVLLTLATLPVRVVAREEYSASVARAGKRIGKRDPDDVDILALAQHLGVPVWSNDNDFEEAGVEWHTTAQLLKKLSIGE